MTKNELYRGGSSRGRLSMKHRVVIFSDAKRGELGVLVPLPLLFRSEVKSLNEVMLFWSFIFF